VPEQRLRITVVLGPSDLTRLAVYKFILTWVVHLYASSPAPLKVSVEMLPED
jgi:hypothetical protein